MTPKDPLPRLTKKDRKTCVFNAYCLMQIKVAQPERYQAIETTIRAACPNAAVDMLERLDEIVRHVLREK